MSVEASAGLELQRRVGVRVSVGVGVGARRGSYGWGRPLPPADRPGRSCRSAHGSAAGDPPCGRGGRDGWRGRRRWGAGWSLRVHNPPLVPLRRTGGRLCTPCRRNSPLVPSGFIEWQVGTAPRVWAHSRFRTAAEGRVVQNPRFLLSALIDPALRPTPDRRWGCGRAPCRSSPVRSASARRRARYARSAPPAVRTSDGQALSRATHMASTSMCVMADAVVRRVRR